MKLIKCDSCGQTRNLIPGNTNERSYFRIVIQDIHAGEVLACGTESEDSYDFITMDICPDCLMKAGKYLNHEKETNQFIKQCEA